MKFSITVEEINQIVKRIEEINSVPFDEIEIFENKKRVVLTPKQIEYMKFIGTTNFSILRRLDNILAELEK